MRLIECRSCDSPSCEGCNVYILKKMLHAGELDCLMNAHHTIVRSPKTLRPTGHWNIRCYSTYDSWTQETDEEFYLECSECKREVWNIDQSAAMGGEYRKLVEQYPYCHCGCKMMEG